MNTWQMTLLGLGRFGRSVGRALSEASKDRFIRIGCDYIPEREKQAQKEGAVDKIIHNIPNAVREADMILLSLPADETESALKLIGSEVKPTALIMDFSPCKLAAAGWAQKYLPNRSLFLGVWAAPLPEQMTRSLFHGGTLLFCPDAETNETVVRNAPIFAKWLGAEPHFADVREVDNVIARSYTAPYLMQSALFASLHALPVWKQTQTQYADLLFQETALMEIPLGTDRAAAALINNRENILLAVNALEAELKRLRDALQEKDEITLESLLKQSYSSREEWKTKLSSVSGGMEKSHLTAVSETFEHAFLGGLFRRKKE